MNNLLEKLKGLKFPDEMVTRFFFKNDLNKRPGRVLELGCGNSNNLGLFSAYGWDCIGLDISSELIEQGKFNFKLQGYKPARLETIDMNHILPNFGPIDCLLMPSSIYYVSSTRAKEIMKELGPTLKQGSFVFCRYRTLKDYRYGKGEYLGNNCFKLKIFETSELDCLNTFYDRKSILEILEPCNLDPRSIHFLNLSFDNFGVNNKLISNNDSIIYGIHR